LRAEKKVAFEHDRNKKIYGLQAADAIASLNADAMAIATGGEVAARTAQARSTGTLFQTTGGFARDLYMVRA
jgi:hypothetical protein